MIKDRGVVEKIVHQKAVVKLRRGSGCDTCGARGSCHAEGDSEMPSRWKTNFTPMKVTPWK